jgi:protein involved in polysaccharide export with SLBB domain
MKLRFLLLIAAWLLPALAFSQAPSAASEEPARARGAAPAAPATSSAPAPAAISAPTGYVLSANDQVAVEVFGEGNLSVPLLGSVHLSGLTLSQAASKLTDMYGRDYLVNPKVNVMLLGYAKRRFTMLGQINRPGSYEMPDGSPEGIDLLEAIAMAGGYTRIAAPERVSVRRGNQVLKVDAKRQARGDHTAFIVQPGDTVSVGESIF